MHTQETNELTTGPKSTQLPISTYQRVVKFAQREGLVKRTGMVNLSQTLARLIELGLDAVDQGGAMEANNDA